MQLDSYYLFWYLLETGIYPCLENLWIYTSIQKA